MFEKGTFIGLIDMNNRKIKMGDRVIGFGSEFEVKFKVLEIEKVVFDDSIIIQVPSFYFEDLETGEQLHAIKYNHLGENDLEGLAVVDCNE